MYFKFYLSIFRCRKIDLNQIRGVIVFRTLCFILIYCPVVVKYLYRFISNNMIVLIDDPRYCCGFVCVQHLFDRLAELLKGGTHKIGSLLILSHIVRREPTWLYKVVGHPLLPLVIKCLKVCSYVSYLCVIYPLPLLLFRIIRNCKFLNEIVTFNFKSNNFPSTYAVFM